MQSLFAPPANKLIESEQDISVGYVQTIHALPNGKILLYSQFTPSSLYMYDPETNECNWGTKNTLAYKITDELMGFSGRSTKKPVPAFPQANVLSDGKVLFDYCGAQETELFDSETAQMTVLDSSINHLVAAKKVNAHQFVAITSLTEDGIYYGRHLLDEIALYDMNHFREKSKPIEPKKPTCWQSFCARLFKPKAIPELPKENSKELAVDIITIKCQDIAVIQDNQIIVSTENNLRIYHIENNKLALKNTVDTKGFIPKRIFIFPNGELACVDAKHIQIRKPPNYECVREKQFDFSVYTSLLCPNIYLLPDGESLIANCSDNKLRMINLKTFQSEMLATGIRSFAVSTTGAIYYTHSAEFYSHEKCNMMHEVKLTHMQKILRARLIEPIKEATPFPDVLADLTARYVVGG